MNRRTFVQMFGLGAISFGAQPVAPLFSGQDSPIWTPEHAGLTRSHLVLVPRRPDLLPDGLLGAWRGRETDLRNELPVIGGRVLHLWDASVDDEVQDIRAVARDDEDLHEVFYRSALRMRTDFAEISTRMFARLPEWQRAGMMLVTLVDVPIFAGALETDERGFYVHIGYTSHIVPASNEIRLGGWETYSENGEYPVEIPSEIDMDRLTSLDREIVARERVLLA